MSKKFKIKLNRKHKRKRLSKSFKENIFERDNYECQLCIPKKNLLYLPNERVIDHKIPLSKGGSNDVKNLWLVCKDCDKKKRNKLYPELSSQYIKNRIGYLENKIIKKRKTYGKNK
jgi:5-methylcytosine-specific restriction endonuclease McrA